MEEILTKKLNLPLYKVCCGTGELVLWDSRCFHMNVPPVSINNRMCTYVCMQLRKYATEEELSRRITYYEQGGQTGHYCYGQRLGLKYNYVGAPK